MIQKIVCRMVLSWMTIILISSVFSNDLSNLRIGPNEELQIFGWTINTWSKYAGVIMYCLVNSVLRTASSNILSPYIINNIQDESKKKEESDKMFAYEITGVTTVYHWFDWYIYMNILLSQIDMVFVEVTADILVSFWTTQRYMNEKGYEAII